MRRSGAGEGSGGAAPAGVAGGASAGEPARGGGASASVDLLQGYDRRSVRGWGPEAHPQRRGCSAAPTGGAYAGGGASAGGGTSALPQPASSGASAPRICASGGARGARTREQTWLMEVNGGLDRNKDQSKESKLMEVNAGGLNRGKDLSKETKKRHWKDSVLMEVNPGVLDRDNEGKKRHLKEFEDGQRKKMCKNNSESESYKERGKRYIEAENYNWDCDKEREKTHMDYEKKLNLRHGKDVKKEMLRKYDKHRHGGGQRREKGHPKEKGHVEESRKVLGRTSESWNSNQDLVRKSERLDSNQDSVRKSKSWNSNQELGRKSERSDNNQDFGRKSMRWDNNQDLVRKTESWNSNQSNQGFLDRWVPTRDSDDERIQDLKSDQPSEEKGEEKKVKSAWLSEETENQHHSPVTLSDVEFSNDFDSRISGREFKIAQDYGHLKSEGPKEKKVV